MPNPDLVVLAINVPPPVVGRCPTKVDVEVANIGSSPVNGPFDVCLDIRTKSLETSPVSHEVLRVGGVEGVVLAPGQTMKLTFVSVRFPCGPSAWLSATADCTSMVPSNLRTNPTTSVLVSPIGKVPHLFTDILRVGLQDSGGSVTWDPAMLCAGGTLVTEVRVRNEGCADAPPSLTTIKLLDAAGQVVSSQTRAMSKIFGESTSPAIQFSSKIPTGTAAITIRVCADSAGSVVPQCDLLHLCAQVTRPVATAPTQPAVTFATDAPIVPGQRPSITWGIQNFCSDLVAVTGQVAFAGVDLYLTSAIPVGQQSASGEQAKAIPQPPHIIPAAAVTAGFFTIGSKQLDLLLKASGTDQGPYKAQAQLAVLPEVVGPTWWAWTGPPGSSTFEWKAGAYGPAGTLTNLGSASMTPSAITLREHDVAVAGTASDVLRSATQFLGPLVPGASIAVPWSAISQSWRWFELVTLVPVGPLSKSFDYTVEFTLTDQYGNSYALVSSAPLRVIVTVSDLKVGAAIVGYVLQIVAVVAFLLALALLAGIITGGGAAVMFALAGAAATLAGIARVIAGDPPVPDFRYDEVVSVDVPQLPTGLDELPPHLTALRSVLELTARILAVPQALESIEGKLLGAYVDRNTEAIRRQAQSYRDAVSLLHRAASSLPETMAEAIRGVVSDDSLAAEHVEQSLRSLRSDGLPDAARRLWDEAGLSDETLRQLEVLALHEPPIPVEPLGNLLERLSAALVTMTEAVEAEAPVVLQRVGE